jgi:hypothetical protein
MSRSSSLHFLRRARRLRGLVGILEEERRGKSSRPSPKDSVIMESLMNAGRADCVEFMG